MSMKNLRKSIALFSHLLIQRNCIPYWCVLFCNICTVLGIIASYGFDHNSYLYDGNSISLSMLSVIVELFFFLCVFFISVYCNRLNLIVFAFSLVELILFFDVFTHRLGANFFFRTPFEFLEIALDTNLDEIKSSFYLSFREKVIIYCFVLNLLVVIFNIFLNQSHKKVKSRTLVVYTLTLIAVLFCFHSYRLAIFRSCKAVSSFTEYNSFIKQRRLFSWGASYDNNKSKNITVVLFLGETHRGDHLHLNGYKKNTTPLLEKERVISYTKMISQAPNTLASTPMILSRKSVFDIKPVAEKSIISAFNEAGFKSWYVSYLSKSHVGDSEINLIANEAHEYIISDVNIDTLRGILSDSSDKKLIVYKTVGSHYLFHTRYPSQFNIFKPSFTDVEYHNPTNSKRDLELYNNSYDNSVYYSLDYQVSSFIQTLKKLTGEVMLVFISDHGVSLLDDGKTIAVGCTKGNYSIANFYWFNEEYVTNNPNFINELERNKNEPITSEYLVDTVLTLSHISSKVTKGKNIIGLNHNHKIDNRFVKCGSKIINYDFIGKTAK